MAEVDQIDVRNGFRLHFGVSSDGFELFIGGFGRRRRPTDGDDAGDAEYDSEQESGVRRLGEEQQSDGRGECSAEAIVQYIETDDGNHLQALCDQKECNEIEDAGGKHDGEIAGRRCEDPVDTR